MGLCAGALPERRLEWAPARHSESEPLSVEGESPHNKISRQRAFSSVPWPLAVKFRLKRLFVSILYPYHGG